MAAYYEPGDYACTVQDIGFGPSKAGNAMITIVLRVDARIIGDRGPDGELHETTSPVQQGTRTTYLMAHTDEAADTTLAKLRYAGFSGDDIGNADQLIGKQVRCYSRLEEWEGETRDKFELMFPPRQRKPIESDSATKRKINALLSGAMKRESGSTKAAAPLDVAAPPPPTPDDALPF